VCGARVFGDPSIVTEETEAGVRTARWTGLVLCNRAGCPVCAAAKVRRFHQQVLRTLGAGGWWQHVTFTVGHHAGEHWGAVYDRALAGLRSLSHGAAGRVVGGCIQATIRATETTNGGNGWHVHFHVLWQISRPLLDAEKRLVAEQWAASTGAAVDRGAWFGALFHCLTETDRAQAAHYLSKLALELAGVGKDAHPGHQNMGEIFRAAGEGAPWAVARVQQYQRETRGKRLYQLDRRATQLHDAAPELPEAKVVASWVTPIDRLEFRALAHGERTDPVACYLPLEVAARSRGDPTDAVLDTLYDLALHSGGG